VSLSREELDSELLSVQALVVLGEIEQAQAMARELIKRHQDHQYEIHRRLAKAYRQGKSNVIPPAGVWTWGAPDDARELTGPEPEACG